MVELFFLLISITILLIIIYYRNTIIPSNTVETFDEQYYLQSCPAGYNTFYNSDGDIVCCDGEIIANKCLGDRQCTLNGKATSDMPKCLDAIMKEYGDKGSSQCPPSMTSYFEDRSTKKKGCTNGQLNATLTGPKLASQPTCKIYPTMDENVNAKDSCFNQKELEKFPCFGNMCTKTLVQNTPNKPVLVNITFNDNTGMPHTATTRASMERSLNATNPKWKEQGMDLYKYIGIAEVAKAYYIDRTMDRGDVTF